MIRPASRPRGGFFFALILAAFCAFVTAAPAATLLPNGKQQFIDQNGAPLSLGSVTFYIPGTTTPKATWQNSTQTILNTNPVLLDSSGQAIIYGAGAYRQIVKDGSGNVIWDAVTADTSSAQIAFGGTSSGSANAQTVTAPNFTSTDGQIVTWKAGFTNTGALSLIVSGVSVIVLKDTPTGPVNLSGAEVVANNDAVAIYDATLGAFHLINNAAVGATPVVSLTATPTTDIGATGTRYVNLTGSGSISSFGSSATVGFPFYTVTVSGSVTLVNGALLVTPSGANISLSSGDFFNAVYQGAGVWKVYGIARAGQGAVNAQVGTTYSIAATDAARQITFANSAAVTVTIPATVALPGFSFDAQNVGSSVVLLVPASGTIAGLSSLVLPPNTGLRVFYDGASWSTIGVVPNQTGRWLLNTLTASSSAALTDTTSLTGLFNDYTVVLDSLVPATGTNALTMTVRSGGAFQTTTYLTYTYYFNATVSSSGAPTTNISIGDSSISNTGAGVSAELSVNRPWDATRKKMFKCFFVDQNSTNVSSGNVVGIWNGGNGAIDGLNFQFTTGNITSGTIRIYGSR